MRSVLVVEHNRTCYNPVVGIKSVPGIFWSTGQVPMALTQAMADAAATPPKTSICTPPFRQVSYWPSPTIRVLT